VGIPWTYRLQSGIHSTLWGHCFDLNKDSFKWDEDADVDKAFQHLNQAMLQAPVLALPNFSKTFVIESDAFEVGISTVLMQNRRHITFFSQTLHGRNLQLSTYEKEMLALVMSIKKMDALFVRPTLCGSY
jgi:hypothetical protein